MSQRVYEMMRPNQAIQPTAGRRDARIQFYETVVDLSKARSRQRWLSLFSLDVMAQLIREHWLKLALPLLLTTFLVAWTLAVQPFSGYGDNWAIWPAMGVLPLALGIHIYLLVTLRPKWPLVGYAAVHLSALLLISIICLMRITKDSL